MRPTISGNGPSARSYHSACVVNDKVYIFGGYDGVTRSNDMYIIEEGISGVIECCLCLVLPSLTSLCVAFIRGNRSAVGSLNILPLELQELITGVCKTTRKSKR
jgi:hypothetical protein